jgi:GxxExxY protein
MENSILQEEGYQLMGAVFEVHRELGGGLAEEIYQESLEHELVARQIPYQSKSPIMVTYKGTRLRREYFPDLLVHG